jgi:hypothetical protein
LLMALVACWDTLNLPGEASKLSMVSLPTVMVFAAPASAPVRTGDRRGGALPSLMMVA